MSSFQGRMSEFPDILVDFFRKGQGPLALACFLSHVHSDHLVGLESFRSPFVYCSAATKAMLLNLERKLARVNYAEGILEARRQTYKHLSKVLKPLPLDSPTRIELAPGYEIQVTLFDANHCTGAVMFLFEGQGKAVLYTGDTRSEPWLVDSLARNPALIEYAAGSGAASGLRTLDRIYLDTTFARRDAAFPTKAEGVAELLRKVASYPADTVFHFQAWTYGYEEVRMALAKALNTQIHVDEYKMRVYSSLSAPRPDPAAAAVASFGTTLHYSPHGPALVGYMRGNEAQPGCLTTLGQDARVHSCERSRMCSAARRRGVVRIKPVLAHSRDGGGDLAEAALLAGDLDREAEYEQSVYQLLASRNTTNEDQARRLLENLVASSDIDLDSAETGLHRPHTTAAGAAALKETATKMIESYGSHEKPFLQNQRTRYDDDSDDNGTIITFPYSRHSSYAEQCHLVDAFRPRDVWPCTADLKEWSENGTSIRDLFGAFCSGSVHAYDQAMEQYILENPRQDDEFQLAVAAESQLRADSSPVQIPPRTNHHQHPSPRTSFLSPPGLSAAEPSPGQNTQLSRPGTSPENQIASSPIPPSPEAAATENHNSESVPLYPPSGPQRLHDDDDDDGDGEYEYDHQDAARGRDAEHAVSSLPGGSSSTRMDAYYAVLRNGGAGDLNLISTRRPALDAEL